MGEIVDNTILKGRLIIAQNAAYEAKINLANGLTEGEYKCTMVNDQIILAGAANQRFDLVSICQRRGVEIPEWMNKDIRLKFINRREDMIFEDEDILYNAGDAMVLPDILKSQQKAIDALNINFLINIRSRIVKILARGENYGFDHNTKKWEEIAEEKIKQAKETCKILTQQTIGKYGIKPETVNSSLMKSLQSKEKRLEKEKERKTKLQLLISDLVVRGKENTKAYQLSKNQLEKISLGSAITSEETEKDGLINWGSSQQVLGILKQINCPLPMGIDKTPGKYGKKPSVGKEARNDWFVEHSDSEFKDFLELFDKFKKIDHNIKSFGKEWVQKYVNPSTGKAYTVFRQTGTTTLRFASGKEEEGYFNLQQIPKETVKQIIDGIEQDVAIYRECFGTIPGRSITTLDYTGCEVVCMVSLSGDLQLKKVTDLPDQHSYMGTKCWRAVYSDRYKRTGEARWKELSESYTMHKGKERDKFKNSGIFPVLYGVKETKVAGVQGFSTRDARVFIDTIEGEMPIVVAFVKSKARFALANGYVLHNTRTNSRRWFSEVLDAKKFGYELSRKQLSEIENAARNSPIQGTNIDIICEAMVLIDRWRLRYKVDIEFMGQVHDELIYDHPDSYNDWIEERLATAMKKAAKNYLMKEISMDVESRQGKTWLKDKRKVK